MKSKCSVACLNFWGALVLVTLAIALMVTAAGAQVQGTATATILGTVNDPSGAPAAGTTITISSPSLQVPALTTKAATDGTYRFNEVPVGTYTVRYELSGFESLVREDIVVTAGFVARLDVSLSVGSMSQSVTVSGESPVIDATTTIVNDTFSNASLQDIPNTRQQYQVLAMTPGITMTGSNTDVGGSQMGTQQTYKNYGTIGESSPSIEGVLFRQELDSSGFFMDYDSLEEFHVQSAAMDAEYDLGGTVWAGVVKSGGNDFHGDVLAAYEPGQLQLTDTDAYLAAHGVTTAVNKINSLVDWFGDLGGRVKRDKLWFYVAVREQHRDEYIAGFQQNSILGPNGLQGNGISLPQIQALWNQTIKVSYQMTKNYKIIGFMQRVSKNLASEQAQAQQAAPFTPLESSDRLGYAPKPMKIELQGTPTNRLVIDAQYGFLGFWNAPRYTQAGQDVAGNPTEEDLSTGWLHGPYSLGYSRDTEEFNEVPVNLTYLPGGNFLGKHILKTGFWMNYSKGGTPTTGKCGGVAPYCSGNYELLFTRLNGLPFQPFEIETFNAPINGFYDRSTEYAGYIKDQWQVGKRLSLDIGARIERWHSFDVASVQPAGQFTAGGSYPAVDVLTWLSGAPRLGAAYDIKGDGKTVLKGSWGWYNWGVGNESFGGDFNKDASVITTYKWAGPCVVTQYTTCDASPVTLASLTPSSPNYVTQTAPGTTLLNPNLTQPRTYETTAGVERELMPNSSIRILYVYRREDNLYMLVNPARPYSSYSVPITVTDPGPTGTGTTGPTLTLYVPTSAFNGAAFVKTQFQNTPSANHSNFSTLEVEFSKRMVNRWGLLASYSALKNHRWLLGTDNAAVVQSPNDLINPTDNTWENDAKIELTYKLPYGFVASAFEQIQQGFGRQRTYLFTGLPVLSSLTVRLAPYGQLRLPTQKLLNVRIARQFRLGEHRSMEATADVYNVMNANTATAINDQSGPNYGVVTAYFPPLIARLGVEFHF